MVDSSEDEIFFIKIFRGRQQEIAEKQKQTFNEIHPSCDFPDNERENCIGKFPNNPLELASKDKIESLNHITIILKTHFANKKYEK